MKFQRIDRTFNALETRKSFFLFDSSFTYLRNIYVSISY